MEWVIGIIVVVLLLIVGMFAGPPKCDICGLAIKKTHYEWKIGGKKQKLCPKCNSLMERKVSKDAFRRKFG